MQPYHTEQELAAALARREEAAAEQLVREYGGLLNAVVRRHAPGLDADDILADALLAIWQNAGRFDGRRSFKAWAAAVARYRAIDAVRRAARTCLAGGTQELERIAGHTPDEYFALELEDMFRGLPDEDRALLLGRYFYGSTPAQQAAARGISVGAVNTRVVRARHAAFGKGARENEERIRRAEPGRSAPGGVCPRAVERGAAKSTA